MEGYMNHEKLSELQSKLDIVSVVSSYIPLTKQGRNYFGVCPFHDDHSPSLCVSPEKQIYKCFVCGEGGNVFDFVKNYEHISFIDAVSLLAKQVGMDLGLKTLKKEDSVNQKYYDMMEIANKFYHIVFLY